jgi:hypothetical protein
MKCQDMVGMTISIPKTYRNLLRMLAAEQSLKNADEVMSAARLGREIICRHLDSMVREKGELEDGNTF